jgi:hypothetical protein
MQQGCQWALDGDVGAGRRRPEAASVRDEIRDAASDGDRIDASRFYGRSI